MTILCKCGCKKTDHHDSYDWGKNRGDCKNCNYSECEGFTKKECDFEGCNEDRDSWFIYCKKHLILDNEGKLDNQGIEG